MVWKQASQAIQNLPSPTDFGYEMGCDDTMQPKLMSQGISAPELLNDIICTYRLNYNYTCTCFNISQTCAAACLCGALPPMEDVDTYCSNPFTLQVSIDPDNENSLNNN